MTRKHFATIAAALLRSRPVFQEDAPPQVRAAALFTWKVTAAAIATELGYSNPRFDRARFLAACGWLS